MFLYLAPLGKCPRFSVIEKVFKIMDDYNINKDVSRIENIPEEDLGFYKSQGLRYAPKDPEYLYKTEDIRTLSGNRFKSRRANLNSFIKNYKFTYLPYTPDLKANCLALLEDWVKLRKSKYAEPLYNGLLQDSLLCQKKAWENYTNLSLVGRIVKVDNKLSAFSLGYKLNPDTFCILFEVCDLKIKGLSEFIFNRVCQESSEFNFVNCLDDSGLSNLRKHKLSWRPVKLIPSYIISYA